LTRIGLTSIFITGKQKHPSAAGTKQLTVPGSALESEVSLPLILLITPQGYQTSAPTRR